MYTYLSHKEQMSLIVRIADLVPKPNIKEYFLGYIWWLKQLA